MFNTRFCHGRIRETSHQGSRLSIYESGDLFHIKTPVQSSIRIFAAWSSWTVDSSYARFVIEKEVANRTTSI
jgi:hypothetical protein